MLGVVVTQPIYASVSDILGRKLPLYAAMLLFAVGSIVFAVAQSMSVVIAGRVLQGLGGGGLDVLEAIIIADLTSLKERPLYLGLMAIPIATGSILGPIVGGLFSEFVSWRWIGWINLPLVGLAFALAVFFLHLRPIDMALGVKIRRLDWGGMLLFTVGATCLALPLSWADSLYPWSSWRTIVPFVIGILVLTVFGFYEKKQTEPVIPYRVLGNITAVMALIGGFIHGLIMYTMLLYLPLFFQAVFLQLPLQAAVSILPFCCLTVGFSIISPVVVELTRRYRLQLWLGWILLAVFLGLWCLVDRTTPSAETNGFQVVFGIGIGIIFTTSAIPIQASVKNVDDTGLAAGILVVFRLFGALVGLAIGSTAFNSVFRQSIAALGPLPEAIQQLEDASQAIGFIPSLRKLDLPNKTMDSLINAYRIPFRTIWIIMTCLSGVGFLTSLFIRERRS
jgi:MFS family permease